jgi:hypothetical protein
MYFSGIKTEVPMTDALEISISNLNGFLCAVDASLEWSVRELKASIESSQGVPILQQKLFAGSTEICNPQLLGKFLNEKDRCLTLILRSPNEVNLLTMLGIDDNVCKKIEDAGLWEGPRSEQQLLEGSLTLARARASTAAGHLTFTEGYPEIRINMDFTAAGFDHRGHLTFTGGYPEIRMDSKVWAVVVNAFPQESRVPQLFQGRVACKSPAKAFRDRQRMMSRITGSLSRASVVVPPGTYKVSVRLSQEMQDLLAACNGPAVDEFSETKPAGWTVADIIFLRGSFLPTDVVRILREAILARDDPMHEGNFNDVDTRMRLVSYGVGEVQYEITLVAA